MRTSLDWITFGSIFVIFAARISAAAIGCVQRSVVDRTRWRAWQGVGKLHPARLLVGGDAGAAVFDQVGVGDLGARPPDHDRLDALDPARIGHPDHGSV